MGKPSKVGFVGVPNNGVWHYRSQVPASLVGASLYNYDTLFGAVTDDVYVLSVPRYPHHYDIFNALKKRGVGIVVDIDDWIEGDCMPASSTYQPPQDHLDTLRICAAEADVVTCTTDWIAERVYSDYGQTEIVVIPNAVDTPRFNAEIERTTERVTIGFCGSSGHREAMDEWMPAIEAALRTDKAALISMGLNLRESLPEELRRYVWQTDAWLPLAMLAPIQKQVDIALAPCLETDFYRMKSDLRAQEAWAAGSALLCGFETYGATVSHGINAQVAHTPAQAEEYLLQLIENPTYRRMIARNGHACLRPLSAVEPLWREAIRLASRRAGQKPKSVAP